VRSEKNGALQPVAPSSPPWIRLCCLGHPRPSRHLWVHARTGHFYVPLGHRCLTTQERHLRKPHWGGEPVLNIQRCHHQPGSASKRFGLISLDPQVAAITTRKSHDILQGCPGGSSGHCPPGQAGFQATAGAQGWMPRAGWRD